jgi:transient receptor potential cation channel subfamily V protein 5
MWQVGETVFHVCFLMGTPIHMHLAKQMLKHFPLLLNDVYLSEEYYGENVLHMAAVAEDPSIVKWLLDIGADFHRRCYGNFFTCDDQKSSRSDNKSYEEVDICLRTNYLGYVAWGEYPFAFAACLEQEECYRLMLSKGANHDLTDTNGCSVTHVLIVFDLMRMWDMAVECGAAINIENVYGLTPLTLAAYLAR